MLISMSNLIGLTDIDHAPLALTLLRSLLDFTHFSNGHNEEMTENALKGHKQ